MVEIKNLTFIFFQCEKISSRVFFTILKDRKATMSKINLFSNFGLN